MLNDRSICYNLLFVSINFLIVQPLNLEPESRLVQWENSVYSSLDINRPGVSLMGSDGFLYSSGWFHGAMRIHRSRLPNFDGKANWNQFLATPPDDVFLKGNSINSL